MGYQRHVAEFSASLRITVKNPAVYDDGAAYSIAQGKIDHSPVCILLPQFCPSGRIRIIDHMETLHS